MNFPFLLRYKDLSVSLNYYTIISAYALFYTDFLSFLILKNLYLMKDLNSKHDKKI